MAYGHPKFEPHVRPLLPEIGNPPAHFCDVTDEAALPALFDQPTGAIRVEDADGKRRTVLTGTAVREQPLLVCGERGVVTSPRRGCRP